MKSQKDTIIRHDLKDGEFATISNKVMLDTNLSSDAFRLMIILLNNSKTWEINVGYFAKKLGWDRKKTAKIIGILEQFGYLTKIKKPLGAKGFEYIYTIDESGSLLSTPSTKETPSTPVADKVEPKQTEAPINSPSTDIESLIEFSNDYAKKYTGATGRKYVIKVLIENKKLTNKEQILQEYDK